GDEETGE
nr:Chain C, NUCLEAR FACTOR ERYTHROID 2-RELATED FACTOR 2 [Homo sapiens]7K2E_P Chain P, GLY-ASP-GLU-GLU-THR-GLY-GLU [Homo sapiens]